MAQNDHCNGFALRVDIGACHCLLAHVEVASKANDFGRVRSVRRDVLPYPGVGHQECGGELIGLGFDPFAPILFASFEQVKIG